jgi:hypothetical protein
VGRRAKHRRLVAGAAHGDGVSLGEPPEWLCPLAAADSRDEREEHEDEDAWKPVDE